MPTYLLLDELHVQVRARPDLPPAHLTALRRRLASEPFRRRIRQAVRAALAGQPWSAAVRVRLTR